MKIKVVYVSFTCISMLLPQERIKQSADIIFNWIPAGLGPGVGFSHVCTSLEVGDIVARYAIHEAEPEGIDLKEHRTFLLPINQDGDSTQTVADFCEYLRNAGHEVELTETLP